MSIVPDDTGKKIIYSGIHKGYTSIIMPEDNEVQTFL